MAVEQELIRKRCLDALAIEPRILQVLAETARADLEETRLALEPLVEDETITLDDASGTYSLPIEE